MDEDLPAAAQGAGIGDREPEPADTSPKAVMRKARRGSEARLTPRF